MFFVVFLMEEYVFILGSHLNSETLSITTQEKFHVIEPAPWTVQ